MTRAVVVKVMAVIVKLRAFHFRRSLWGETMLKGLQLKGLSVVVAKSHRLHRPEARYD